MHRLFPITLILIAFTACSAETEQQIEQIGTSVLEAIPEKEVIEEIIDVVDAVIDSDNDGLTDLMEAGLGTDPLSSDTDGDGFDDKTEVDNGYNPLEKFIQEVIETAPIVEYTPPSIVDPVTIVPEPVYVAPEPVYVDPAPTSGCDPNYSGCCVPIRSGNSLNCPDVACKNFRVVGTDKHLFDRDKDRVACES